MAINDIKYAAGFDVACALKQSPSWTPKDRCDTLFMEDHDGVCTSYSGGYDIHEAMTAERRATGNTEVCKTDWGRSPTYQWRTKDSNWASYVAALGTGGNCYMFSDKLGSNCASWLKNAIASDSSPGGTNIYAFLPR